MIKIGRSSQNTNPRMTGIMNRLIALTIFLLLPHSVYADAADELKDLVGYTIIANKTIVGYQDKDGKKKDSFEGCDYDRIIIFDDNKILNCAEYGYQYAYRPTAIIFSNGSSFKMLVEDEMYDMRR